MKYLIIFVLLLSPFAVATQDGVCVGSEEERIQALRKLIGPVNSLLKNSDEDVIFVSELDENLVPKADKAISQDYVIISGSSSSHKMHNALVHYCITKYLACGHEGSRCYVSLSTGEGKCYAGGLVCAAD